MKIDLSHDVVPITELIQKSAKLVGRLQTGKQPVLITQHGHPAMICLDVGEFQRQQEKIELMEALLAGETDFAKGRYVEWGIFSKKLAEA